MGTIGGQTGLGGMGGEPWQGQGEKGAEGTKRLEPGEYPFFVDVTGEVYSPATPLYDQFSTSPLGNLIEEEDDRQTNRCFNCGSPDHIISSCPEPLNRPLISLSRSMYEFFRNPRNPDPERLHEYEGRKLRRLEFCKAFTVGYISGELLREALGLSESDDKDGDLPWYWNMMDWGYPPGWYASQDPTGEVLSRIEGEGEWESEPTLIYDENGEVTDPLFSQNSGENSVNNQPDSDSEDQLPPKRWAKYPTDLFSSDLLPVYSGQRLPPMGMPEESPSQPSSQSSTALPNNNPQRMIPPPPWRRPGAFGAFGPPGWQNFVKSQSHLVTSSNPMPTSRTLNTQSHNTLADDEPGSDRNSDSDMDMSD